MTATMTLDRPGIGDGLYSVTGATRILGHGDRSISQTKVRRWLEAALTFSRRDFADGSVGLTFHDLVSLELVARFRERGVSMQKVHTLEARLQKRHPDLERPFAYDVFYSDGTSIWAGLGPDDAIEVVGDRPVHYVWAGAIRSFAEEIDYSTSTRGAARWRPAPGVEIDPTRQFGQPVVAGTRTRVATVLSALREGSQREVAEWYGLSARQVAAAKTYGEQ